MNRHPGYGHGSGRFFIHLIVALFFVMGHSPVMAEDYSTAQTFLHSFNNNITVFTGVFSLNKELSLQTTTYFKYTVDMINPEFGEGDEEGEGDEGSGSDKKRLAKSLAAVSGASTAAGGGGGASDTRNDLLGGFTHSFGSLFSLEAYLDYSQEKDYASLTPILSFKKEFFEKNTTLTLGYSHNADRLKGLYMTATDTKDTDNLYVGLTQILSPTTISQVGYSRSDVRGYIPEGNRLVVVDGFDPATCTALSATCLGESFPGERIRESALVGVNHYLIRGLWGWTPRASVRLFYRYYWDDWDITSHTEEMEFVQYLQEKTLVRLTLRNYTQAGAFFVKTAYTSSDPYRSATPPLESQDGQLYGIKLSHTFRNSPVYGMLADSSLEFGYDYYTQSLGVSANDFMFGLRFRF